jgi:hypothetical protein
MKQIAQTILLLLAFCVLPLTAQAQDVKKAIRAHYAEAKAYVDQVKKMEAEGFSYPVPQYFSAHVKQNLPATGFHQEEVLMYYQERRDSDSQIYPSLYLDFAVKKYNFAAREYYEEYLYDEQGRIQFIYATAPILDYENDYEFRLYFSDGQLVELLVKRRPQGKGEYTTVYTGKTVPEEYQSSYNGYLSTSQSVMLTFNAINDGRQL